MNTEKAEEELEDVRKQLDNATRMVAALVLRAGGRVNISAKEFEDAQESVITTSPDALRDGLDIVAYKIAVK